MVCRERQTGRQALASHGYQTVFDGCGRKGCGVPDAGMWLGGGRDFDVRFGARGRCSSSGAKIQTIAVDPGGGQPLVQDQSASVNSSFESARKKVEGMSKDAGDAAKTTVEGAKDAAGAVARIPTARAVSGHEKCQVAPNGAPDCVAAASTMCKAKGFESGKSLDMTTAEVCPPKVYMSRGRSTGPDAPQKPSCHAPSASSGRA